jgi:hypothetical protein
MSVENLISGRAPEAARPGELLPSHGVAPSEVGRTAVGGRRFAPATKGPSAPAGGLGGCSAASAEAGTS